MSDVLLRIADPAVGAVLIACGTVLWVRRPRTLVGPLMVAAGAAWFLGSIWAAAIFVHRGPMVHLHISYPTGRIRRPLALATVVCAYAGSIVEAIATNPWVTLAMAVLVSSAAVDIYARTSGPARKAGGPALGAGLTFAAVLTLSAANQLLAWEYDRLVVLLYDLVVGVVALVLAADLMWGRWTEATVADFVTQLGDRPDLRTLQGALQHALGDRTVAIGYWVPDQHRYVNDRGQPFPLPDGEPSRAVIHVNEQDEPVAALVHDSALGLDEGLLTEVTGALRLALGNARLRAQVRTNLSQLGIARRRLVEAADTQRQRLESELDGGPQHELSEMSLLLESLVATGDPHLRDRLTPLLAELEAAQQELRDLAHGIRPPALESGGLAVALQQLIGQTTPGTVELTVAAERLSPAVEGALYFVCTEALTNIAKHARATQTSLAVHVDHDMVVAQIVDDGRGGADRHGSGLRGLADRVEALGGELTIRERIPRGTEVIARIPRQEAS